MKNTFLRVCAVLMVAVCALSVCAQMNNSSQSLNVEKKQRTYAIWGHLRDSFTGAAISGAKITLMDADSVVLDTITVGSNERDAWYRFDRPAVPASFIIKASHPDYEDCYVDLRVAFVGRNRFFDAKWHYMKRRMKSYADYELGLDSVVVRATRVKMAYRGDTLVFDASAFKLPDGSMLDDLVRQMPGVKIDDAGVITVNGRKVDYLMLNGKDFFKGNNKVMLENLPYYTVNNVQVYERMTDKSKFVGKNVEEKDYVMDVNLKREYNIGYLGNVAAGGANDDHYLARVFASRFSDLTRVSVYASANNINISGSPDLQGNWNNNSSTIGTVAHRVAGVSVRTDGKDKWYENTLDVQGSWDDKATRSSVAKVDFVSSGNAFSVKDDGLNKRNRDMSLSNVFKLKLPVWLESDTKLSMSDERNDAVSRGASFDGATGAYGDASAVLDSVFAPHAPDALQRSLVNRSFVRSHGVSRNLSLSQRFVYNMKLPWGDNIEAEASVNYGRTHSRQNQDYRLHYADRGNDDRLLYESNPSKNITLYGRGEYYVNVNKWTMRFYSLFQRDRTNAPREYYRLERLPGWNPGAHRLTDLPNADSLLLALSPDDSHRMKAIYDKWNSGFNIYWEKQTDSTYLWLRFHLPVMLKHDRFDYLKAAVDTCATRTKWVLNGNVNFNYQWNHRRDRFAANLWHNTNQPNISNYVAFDYSNPLALRLASAHLKNEEKWETVVEMHHASPGNKLNVDGNVQYAYTSNPIITGFSYNKATGGYAYRNVNSNYAYTAMAYGQVEGQLGHWSYVLGCALTRGKAQAMEMGNTESEGQLYNTVSEYVSPRLMIGYQLNTLNVTLESYNVMERNKYESSLRTDYKDNYYDVRLDARYTIPVLKLDVQSRLTYSHSDCNLDNVPTKDIWIWNVSLGRSFMKNKGLAVQFVASDILRSVSDVSYLSMVNGFSIERNKRIGRLFMLSASYNFFAK